MSEQQAYLRITIARLARRYPVVLDMLAEGALTLSTLKLLNPHLTDENCLVLLERARGKTKDEVEMLVAEVAPQPDVPNKLRKLPERAAPMPPSRDAEKASQELEPAPLVRSSVDAAAKDDAAAVPSQVGQDGSTAFALEAPRSLCTLCDQVASS